MSGFLHHGREENLTASRVGGFEDRTVYIRCTKHVQAHDKSQSRVCTRQNCFMMKARRQHDECVLCEREGSKRGLLPIVRLGDTAVTLCDSWRLTERRRRPADFPVSSFPPDVKAVWIAGRPVV